MAETIISLLLDRICNVFTRQVQEKVSLVVGVKKQVDKLKITLFNIQCVLEDAERKQVTEKAVREWLVRLKDVCYEVDDVLDEWAAAILTWKMDEENTYSLKKMRSFMRSPCFCLNQGFRYCDIILKIKAVSEKLDEIDREGKKYQFVWCIATDHELFQPPTTSIVDESIVWGRDDEKIFVISKLLAESSQEARDVDVISLVGLGGIGKTTLAQLVFNDVNVKDHFEKKIWVWFSKQFDEVRLVKAILEQLEESTPNCVALQTLLSRVHQSISGKRVLFVLDNVWTENHSQWEQVKPSLACCARGSKILVTTCNVEVAKKMGKDHQIEIKTLSDDACMSIFNHEALNDEFERPTDIGNEIVNKCKGLPLAAKVLGGLMQPKQTREEWEDVLSSELWRLDEIGKHHIEKKLFLPLLLSYYDLPPVVRQCFLYCAIFPKDYKMDKVELVKMWMAQGYLDNKDNRDMKLVGDLYFQVLATRSFFQDIKRYGRDELRFKMHGIVHDFAQYMSKNECLIVDDNSPREALETSTARVRHLNIMVSEETSFLSSIYRVKGLRSLLIGNTRALWLGSALPDLFKQLTCIRSLNLSGSSIEEIPKEVGKLIHLRHLNLEGCEKLVSLPETMCDLFHLQSLDVIRCSSLMELPLAIDKLVNLRHLCIDGSGVAFIPKGIKRLTCLRTLDCFSVCGGGENESKAANLRELKNLDHIGGSLQIRNLRGGITDTAEAQLKNKKHLLCLELHFCVNHEDIILIDVLQPPLYLERLSINTYGGIGLPNWMMALTKLQELEIIACENLKDLPPLGRLPNLENLKVEHGDGIERRVGEEDATTTSIVIMPQLQKLRIFDCPLLRALPDYVLAAPLQLLDVRRCPNLSKCYGKEKGEDWHKISHIREVSISLV